MTAARCAPLGPSQITLEGLLKKLPQDTVANFGYLQVIDGEMMLACRDPKDLPAIKKLNRREYQTLLVGSQGLTYDEIGNHLSIANSTVRTHLNHAYSKLGAINLEEAATFIPIAAELIPSGSDLGLTEAQETVLNYMSQGLVSKQIGYEMGKLDESTIRTHRANIVEKLGIQGSAGRIGVRLRRTIGAITVANDHRNLVLDVANHRIGEIASAIANGTRIEDGFVLAGRRIDDPQKLADAIFKVMGVQEPLKEIMQPGHTADIARTIVENEVALLFGSSPEAPLLQRAA